MSKRRLRDLKFVGVIQQQVTVVRNGKRRDENNIRLYAKPSNN